MCRRALRYKIGVAIWLNNQQTCVRINGLPASFRMSVVSSLGSVVILDISSLLRARRGWLVAQQVVRQGQDSTGHELGSTFIARKLQYYLPTMIKSRILPPYGESTTVTVLGISYAPKCQSWDHYVHPFWVPL